MNNRVTELLLLFFSYYEQKIFRRQKEIVKVANRENEKGSNMQNKCYHRIRSKHFPDGRPYPINTSEIQGIK